MLLRFITLYKKWLPPLLLGPQKKEWEEIRRKNTIFFPLGKKPRSASSPLFLLAQQKRGSVFLLPYQQSCGAGKKNQPLEEKYLSQEAALPDEKG